MEFECVMSAWLDMDTIEPHRMVVENNVDV